jgi:hypothetical protein
MKAIIHHLYHLADSMAVDTTDLERACELAETTKARAEVLILGLEPGKLGIDISQAALKLRCQLAYLVATRPVDGLDLCGPADSKLLSFLRGRYLETYQVNSAGALTRTVHSGKHIFHLWKYGNNTDTATSINVVFAIKNLRAIAHNTTGFDRFSPTELLQLASLDPIYFTGTPAAACQLASLPGFTMSLEQVRWLNTQLTHPSTNPDHEERLQNEISHIDNIFQKINRFKDGITDFSFDTFKLLLAHEAKQYHGISWSVALNDLLDCIKEGQRFTHNDVALMASKGLLASVVNKLHKISGAITAITSRDLGKHRIDAILDINQKVSEFITAGSIPHPLNDAQIIQLSYLPDCLRGKKALALLLTTPGFCASSSQVRTLNYLLASSYSLSITEATTLDLLAKGKYQQSDAEKFLKTMSAGKAVKAGETVKMYLASLRKIEKHRGSNAKGMFAARSKYDSWLAIQKGFEEQSAFAKSSILIAVLDCAVGPGIGFRPTK